MRGTSINNLKFVKKINCFKDFQEDEIEVFTKDKTSSLVVKFKNKIKLKYLFTGFLVRSISSLFFSLFGKTFRKYDVGGVT